MKQGSFRAVRLIVFLLFTLCLAGLSVFADEFTNDWTSIILESFSGDTMHQWTVGDHTFNYDFEWKLDASKFATQMDNDTYPKLTYVPAWPQAIYGTNRTGQDLKSLGIWGRFDRRGYNWIDVYPASTDSGEPFEIPIPGRLKYLDMWVWGSNLNFYVEAYFRDYQGVVHTLYMGSLAYQGWKNLQVQIPNNIPQARRISPRLASLSFVKFRIWTTPVERVDNFYVYFDRMKILTDTFETHFDGEDLADPFQVQEFWLQ